MRDIRASVEVRALIGAEKLRELRGGYFGRYECWQCGKEGQTTKATSVIVFGHRVFRVVKLAHAACADSQIIEVGAAGMQALADRGTSVSLGPWRQFPCGKTPGRGCPA
jgi:hypothetical protein